MEVLAGKIPGKIPGLCPRSRGPEKERRRRTGVDAIDDGDRPVDLGAGLPRRRDLRGIVFPARVAHALLIEPTGQVDPTVRGPVVGKRRGRLMGADQPVERPIRAFAEAD